MKTSCLDTIDNHSIPVPLTCDRLPDVGAGGEKNLGLSKLRLRLIRFAKFSKKPQQEYISFSTFNGLHIQILAAASTV